MFIIQNTVLIKVDRYLFSDYFQLDNIGHAHIAYDFERLHKITYYIIYFT